VNALEPQVVSLSVLTGPLAAPVLARVVGMLAARAELPVDRLEDAVLVADTIADHAARLAPGGRLDLTAEIGDGQLVLQVGPLPTERAEALLARARVPGVGNVLERLADDVELTTDGWDQARLRVSFNG